MGAVRVRAGGGEGLCVKRTGELLLTAPIPFSCGFFLLLLTVVLRCPPPAPAPPQAFTALLSVSLGCAYVHTRLWFIPSGPILPPLPSEIGQS